MPSVQQVDRRLKIVACQLIYQKVNQLGHSYEIWEVQATKMDGTLVREKLRSFEELPVGREIDVTIRPYESERHGKSFTLTPKGRSAPQGNEQVTELMTTVGELVKRVDELERRLRAAPAPPQAQLANGAEKGEAW